jgi:uncharacterized protein DUF2721
VPLLRNAFRFRPDRRKPSPRCSRCTDLGAAHEPHPDAIEASALSAQLVHLHRRSVALEVAVVLGAVGGAATCGAVLALFVGALREATIASLLFALFGLAAACALGAIVSFEDHKAEDHKAIAVGDVLLELAGFSVTVRSKSWS